LAVGALAQGWLVDVIGRKKAFYIAAVSSLVGAALITGSMAIGMLIAVRLLHGFGLGMLICLVPLYLTEVAPPRHRGVLSGLTTLSFGMGYFVYVQPAVHQIPDILTSPSCSWLSIGTYYAKEFNVQVRVPLALAMVGPAALLVGLPFIPGGSHSSRPLLNRS
jgi:MFS family permease